MLYPAMLQVVRGHMHHPSCRKKDYRDYACRPWTSGRVGGASPLCDVCCLLKRGDANQATGVTRPGQDSKLLKTGSRGKPVRRSPGHLHSCWARSISELSVCPWLYHSLFGPVDGSVVVLLGALKISADSFLTIDVVDAEETLLETEYGSTFGESPDDFLKPIMADATKDSDSLGEERLEKWKAYKRLSPKPYENTKLPEKPPPLGSKIIAVQTEKAQSVPEVHRKVPKVTAPLDENQRRKKLLCLFREFVAHCVFVILVTIVAFGRINPIMYYFGDALHRLFTTKVFYDEHVKMTTFQDINTVDEFWKYLRGDFLDMLFMNFDKETPNRFEDALIILQNALIGAVRIRQVRVRNDSCTVPDAFRGDFPGCYHYYSKDGEDKEPYGLNEGTAWTYNEPSTLGSGWYNGRISWYGGGGYYVDLFNNLEECNQALEDLWNNTWIDRGTRAVFIDFTAYSPNVNLFCSASTPQLGSEGELPRAQHESDFGPVNSQKQQRFTELPSTVMLPPLSRGSFVF
ncbi:hypothetical protein AAG570_003897 [Ranatra chinensis]|uniref:Polycystin domain-containing protein n=1 Tax=Ranatra chinensis TaxID=642074 RepID=A0ABD0Y2Z0_9HEMI